MAGSENPYLRFGTGSDPLALATLVLALISLAIALSPRLTERLLAMLPERRLLALLALLASLLSFGYVEYYLRGGPRIIDAAYYYLEGRALARGYFDFPLPAADISFSGRFLLAPEHGETLGVLFPPGYPAALALAFRLGVPMALGPALAACLVLLTYRLARALGGNERVALTAAGLSLVSAALRYHTADTMSHGFSAVLVALALLLSMNGRPLAVAASGLASGWLVATRPVTGVIVVLSVSAYLLWRQRSWLSLARYLLVLLPGLALLAAYQHALTGDWLGSTQLAYYARADGPPGCFRYGFGAGIGCLFEHGDYVRARLPHGYGLGEAVATTLRRLLVHSVDVANAAPLALAVPVGAWLAWREPGARLVAAVTVAVILGYAPFYFEGSFPGGGARFFADVLPLEHALLAFALASRAPVRFAWPVTLLGFALHASRQHTLLREREGGRPMFEQSELARRGIDRGVLFVDTDHAFALAHQPGQLSPKDGLVVARTRGAALDALLLERLRSESAVRYRFEPTTPHARPTVADYRPVAPSLRRLEAEALWPVLAARQGAAYPTYASGTCASAGRLLRLESSTAASEITVRFPRWPDGPARIRLGWFGSKPHVRLAWAERTTQSISEADWQDLGNGCWRSALLEVPGARTDGSVELTLSTQASGTALWDYVEWESIEADKGVDN